MRGAAIQQPGESANGRSKCGQASGKHRTEQRPGRAAWQKKVHFAKRGRELYIIVLGRQISSSWHLLKVSVVGVWRCPRGGRFQQTGSAPAGVTWAAGSGGWGPRQGEPAAWAADWRGAGRSAALLAAVVGLFLGVCRGGGWQLGMQLGARNWQRWRLQAISIFACAPGPQQRRPGSTAQQFGRVHRAGPSHMWAAREDHTPGSQPGHPPVSCDSDCSRAITAP